MGASDIERGDRAKEVLDNEVYQDAYALVDQELTRRWKREENPAVRERLWTEQMLLAKVRTQLESAMLNGKMERERQSLPKRALDLVRAGLR